MSNIALSWAFRCHVGNASAKAVLVYLADRASDDGTAAFWTGNGVLDRFLEDESLFGEFLRTPVSEGGVEPLVVEPPHIVVEVGA